MIRLRTHMLASVTIIIRYWLIYSQMTTAKVIASVYAASYAYVADVKHWSEFQKWSVFSVLPLPTAFLLRFFSLFVPFSFFSLSLFLIPLFPFFLSSSFHYLSNSFSISLPPSIIYLSLFLSRFFFAFLLCSPFHFWVFFSSYCACICHRLCMLVMGK